MSTISKKIIKIRAMLLSNKSQLLRLLNVRNTKCPINTYKSFFPPLSEWPAFIKATRNMLL